MNREWGIKPNRLTTESEMKKEERIDRKERILEVGF